MAGPWSWLSVPESQRAGVEAAAATVKVTPSGAAVGGSTVWGVGWGRMAPADWMNPPAGMPWSREAAMSVPTISRARDLICSAVAALPFQLYRLNWNPARGAVTEETVPPLQWFGRPDPTRTRNWILAWTTDDLLFHGRAYWRVTSRYADTYPRSFERMPAIEVNVTNDNRVRWRNATVDPADVVEFLSPIEGLLTIGWRTINTALNLDAAADRFSLNEVPAGWLRQTGGEPLSAEELDELAARWQAARQARATAALNEQIEYIEADYDPSKMQLVEAREHQAVELARLANVPAYLVNAPAGTGMTYLNAEQAKTDLIDFGALPYINCLEQTLGGPNVVPAGQYIRLDLNAWLRNPFTAGDPRNEDLSIAYDPADQPRQEAPDA